MATHKLPFMPTEVAVHKAERRLEFASADVMNSSIFLFWHCLICGFVVAFQLIEGGEVWATGSYLVLGMFVSIFVRVLVEHLAQNRRLALRRNVSGNIECLQLSLVVVAFGFALNAEIQDPHWLSTFWLAIGVLGCLRLLRAYDRLRAARPMLQQRLAEHRDAVDSLMKQLISHPSET